MNMIFTELIIELILPSKYYIFREYSYKHFLKILIIAKFMNFLVKKVVFRVIFYSVFFSMLKLRNHYETYEILF